MDIIEPLMRVVWAIAAVVTWYGPDCTDGNPYVAAWWHGELPRGAPAIVDYQYLGVATASREIEFGTRIRFTIIGLPGWAEDDYDYLIGRSVVATVVDRLADENGEVEFDLQPAAFLELTGDLDIGVVYSRTEILHRTVKNGYQSKYR